MPAVIAHFSLPAAWQTPFAMKKAFTRWSHTCKAFGVTDLCLIDVDGLGVDFGDREMRLRMVDTLEEALFEFPAMTPVYVEEGGTQISKFQWPNEPLFIYGDDFGELPEADLSIPTKNPLNAEIANAIVLSAWRQHGS